MTDFNKLVDLGIAAASKTNIPKEYTLEDINATLRDELKDYNNYSYYREHKNTLFSLIEQVANVVVPRKVKEQFGLFAELQIVNNGEKIVFKQKTGVSRGKNFITRAAEYGTYRTFNLDSKDITMSPKVYAGAATLELGDFLCGRVDMAELMNIIIEGLSDSIYNEVQKALIATFTDDEMPAANKGKGAGYIANVFDSILSTVEAYGDAVTIYCTKAFASKLYNKPGFIGSATSTNPTSALADFDDVREMGYIGRYKGSNVVLLKQSFEDENNTVKVVKDAYAYIMPTGKDKPVKIGIEGGTLIDENKKADGSIDVQAQHMFDVAVVGKNYWGIYEDTELEEDSI